MSKRQRARIAAELRAAIEAGPRLGNPCGTCGQPTYRVNITCLSDTTTVYHDYCLSDGWSARDSTHPLPTLTRPDARPGRPA